MSRTGPRLPDDGVVVTGITYPSDEYNREPEEVSGKLTTRPSPFGTPQCWVDGVQVDPSTVEAVDKE